MTKDIVTKEYLIKEYIDNNKSAQIIATEIGCKVRLIYLRLKHFGIKTKNKCVRTKYNIKNGNKYGKWTIIDDTVINRKILCRCECGIEKMVYRYDVIHNRVRQCAKCRDISMTIDLSGRKIGKWTVLHKSNKSSRSSWVCQCECGRTKTLQATSLHCGDSKSCGKCNTCGPIHGQIWTQILRGALARNIKVLITIEDAAELFMQQNGKCALSGRKIEFGTTNKTTTASLDRIDRHLPYTIDNCQWVHKRVNICKHILNNDEFIQLCRNITDYTKDINIKDKE